MAGLFGYMAGGALTGLGSGMMEQARMKRDEKLRMLEMEMRNQDRRDTQEYRGQALDLQREQFAFEKQHKTDTLAADTEYKRGVLSAKKAASDDFSPGDKRLWDTVIKRHTVKGALGEESTDWQAAAQEFNQRGRDDMSRLAVPDGGTAEMKKEARAQAEREARDRRSLFRSRASEFPETQGSKEEWINRRTQEILGGGGMPAQKGGGSMAMPLAEPKTQQEYDALPSGTRFKAPDGTTRVKP